MDKTEIKDENSSEYAKTYVTKHLLKELKNRKLMVSAKDGAVLKLKEVIHKYYLNLVNKIEHLMKVVAKKSIVTKDHVETACAMCE